MVGHTDDENRHLWVLLIRKSTLRPPIATIHLADHLKSMISDPMITEGAETVAECEKSPPQFAIGCGLDSLSGCTNSSCQGLVAHSGD